MALEETEADRVEEEAIGLDESVLDDMAEELALEEIMAEDCDGTTLEAPVEEDVDTAALDEAATVVGQASRYH